MYYGRYETVSELGRGSMGVVYQAHDPQIDRTVALKVLRQDRHTSEAFVRRFIKEAKAIGRLSHPNIVTVYDAGEDQGSIYIAMEFLEGRPLNELILERRFSLEEVLSVGIQVAETLDYAHGKGVIHRDIKPSNIMVLPKGLVKLTDFGIAHMDDPSATMQTQDGEILGTPAYMSPEQVLGHSVDGRSDIFSLGVILYELSTGMRPFGREGKNLATTFNEIVHSQPVEPAQVNADLHPGLAAIIMKCLSKEPEARYPSGDALAEALRKCRKEQEAVEATLIAPPVAPERKGKANVPMLALFLLVLLAGSLYFMAPGHLGAAWQALGSLFRTAPPPAQVALFQLTSIPAGAQVHINGEPRGKTPLDLELPLGRYVVGGSLPGHADWSEEVSLNEARRYALQMELRKEPELAVVKFESRPPGAQVFVDGAPEGKTPVGRELPLGEHSVRMVLSGFNDWEQKFTLREVREYPVSAELTPTAESRLATLKVDTTPAGVAIYVNDELRGRSPLEVSLPLGKHLVRMRLDGYMDWVEVVQLGEQKGYPLQVDLKPVQPLASLKVTTIPPGANVTVDGRLEGQSPVALKLPAGNRTVRVFLQGYQDWSDTVLLQEGRDTPLEVNLKHLSKDALLSLMSDPAKAKVFINGIARGETPLQLSLPPGKYDVRMTLGKFRDWESQVQLKAAEEHPLNARMVPEPPKRQPIQKPRQTPAEVTPGRTQPRPPVTEDWGVGEWRSRRLNQGQ